MSSEAGPLPMHMLVSHLTSRSVMRVSGPLNSAVLFLQGMVTNDMRPLEAIESRERAVYAALLSPKGKVLYDLIFTREKDRDVDGGASILVDVDSGGMEGAMELLDRYKMRRPLTIENLSSTHRVYAAFHPSSKTPISMSTQLDATRLGNGWRADPRLPALGFRGIFESQSSFLDQGMILMRDEEAFKRLRYSNGVAEGSEEMVQAVPLEYSLDSLNGISYNKGCYVGQERISYTHYRGVIRRRCIPIRIKDVLLPDDQKKLIGCDIHLKKSQELGKAEAVGSVRALSGGVGLAMVKMSALGAVDEPWTIEPSGMKCVPQQPAWWKEEWNGVS